MPVVATPIESGSESLWVTVGIGDGYFVTRLYSDSWTNADDDKKLAALVTAQRDIEYCPDFVFTSDDKSDPSTEMQYAVCEQALTRLLDPDLDLRKTLQAQGVSFADIVKEQYLSNAAGRPALNPRVFDILNAYTSDRKKISSITTVRKEAPTT